MPKNNECCGGLGKNKMNDCDHRYWPTGNAFTDYADFIRDEQLWLKTYTRAWHLATENG